MLYDILSPLIFFASLGGILLIIGRVVIRIRREQLSTNIRSVAAHTPSALSSSWQMGGGEVTQLLKPTQKSVHALRSRFALFGHMVRQTKDTAVTWRTRRREAKAAKVAVQAMKAAEIVLVTPPVPLVQTEVEQSGVVAQPRRRWQGLSDWRERRASRKVAAAETVAQQVSADVEKNVTAETVVPPLTPVVVPVITPSVSADVSPAAAIVPPAPVADSRGFASTLIKRVQAKRANSKQPDALQSAEAELSQQHYQVAEDMLVPYIVKHPKDTAAYMLLGKAAMGREAWSEAMEIFEQVIKWNRKQVGAYTGLGIAAYHAGKFTRALQALQRAQDSDPISREVLDCLMSIAEKMDNPALQHSIREKIEQLEAEASANNVPENATV